MNLNLSFADQGRVQPSYPVVCCHHRRRGHAGCWTTPQPPKADESGENSEPTTPTNATFRAKGPPLRDRPRLPGVRAVCGFRPSPWERAPHRLCYRAAAGSPEDSTALVHGRHVQGKNANHILRFKSAGLFFIT